MNYSVKLSGYDKDSLGATLKAAIGKKDVAAIGIASAFVSVSGFRALRSFMSKRTDVECRLIAGTSHSITHPQALYEALEAGWKVRLGVSTGNRIFHPKILVSGSSFNRAGKIVDPSFAYVGSSNLTLGGLYGNVECGVVAGADAMPSGLGACFASLWDDARRATNSALDAYSDKFARRNRQRTPVDMVEIGVFDVAEGKFPNYSALDQKDVARPGAAIPQTAASAAWAGLESFTGGYRFQVEFPRAAGMVLNRIIGGVSNESIKIYCTNDKTVREVTYRYYHDNGMFRLNIPNDIPGIEKARHLHQGIALVEAANSKVGLAKLTILPAGRELEVIVGRSVALGTWGKTSTRKYGWY